MKSRFNDNKIIMIEKLTNEEIEYTIVEADFGKLIEMKKSQKLVLVIIYFSAIFIFS